MCTGFVLPGLMEKQPEAAGIIRALESQTKQQSVGVGSAEADRCKPHAPTRLPTNGERWGRLTGSLD